MPFSDQEINGILEENKDLKKQLTELSSQQHSSKKNILKTSAKGIRFWAGADLNNSFNRVYEELPSVTKTAFAELSASLVKRLTRIGFFTIFFAIIPSFLLVIQTVILFQQNKKLEKQNGKIEQQVYLEEASRRNNLVFLMDNVLNIVHDELESSSRLSTPTIARIQSLMYGFRPYRFLENDKLTKPLSPEKGQFLLALINSNINANSMQEIFKASFNNVYLKGANMFAVNLENVDMPTSDLQNADFYNANLKNANLEETNFSYANLRKANLNNTSLRFANLNYADLNTTILDNAFLDGASLKGANLTNTSLNKTHVGSKSWITDLKKWEVIGAETIAKTYTLDGPHKNEFGKDYYTLIRK